MGGPPAVDPLLAARRAHLDLLKRTVTGYCALGSGTRFAEFNPLRCYDEAAGRWAVPVEAIPLTLLDKGQLDLIEALALDLEQRSVPGDFIEAGVWRGGAVAFMRALVRLHDWQDRRVVAADSFSGIPIATGFRHDPVNAWPDRWVASLDTVKNNIERLGLLDDGVEFVAGLFEDTLAGLADRRFALIRLDADTYDSTMTALRHLYPLVSEGGVVVIDDWHLFGCKLAVETYRADHGITDPVVTQSGNAYWIKQDIAAP